jgi:asparagine synthase (glutamine-hydrolysing)
MQIFDIISATIPKIFTLQFSDGVGYGWIDSLKELAEERVSDIMFEYRANRLFDGYQLKHKSQMIAYRFTHNVPATKEAYMYRSIFEELYPQPAAVHTVPGGPSIACSTARALQVRLSFVLVYFQ